MQSFIRPVMATALSLLLFVSLSAFGKPVKVFILSGQSNMEGKASVSTLDAVLADPAQRDAIKHLKKDGQWVKRDDVFVTFLDRKHSELSPAHGPLSVGFGTPKSLRGPEGKRANYSGVGPELGIGWVLGEHFDEPVLLIKAAWGGRALKQTFRPPSAMPTDDEIKARLAQVQKKNPDMTLEALRDSYGSDYRKVVSEVERVLNDIDQYVPGYDKDDGYELAGFIWFQGWNDMVGGGNPAYTEQLAHFIRDMRKDLNAPDLPFVIGEQGNGGEEASEGMQTFRDQQKAVAELPEFKGNVALARTAPYWPDDMGLSEDWKVFRKLAKTNENKPEDDPTRIHPGEFYKINWEQKNWDRLKYQSDRVYHYMGSGLCYYQMGESMGKAMLSMFED